MNPVRARLLAAALMTTLGAMVAPQTAAAIPPSSQITTPASVLYPLRDSTLPEGGGTVTVAGTSAGIGSVDIRCFIAGETTAEPISLLASSVPAGSGTFSVTISRLHLPAGFPTKLCALRAVPHEEKAGAPPGASSEFKGPLLAPAAFTLSNSNVFGASNTLVANMEFGNPATCAIESNLYNAAGEASDPMFWCDGVVHDTEEGLPGEGRISIDGGVAFSPHTAAGIAESLGTTGAPDYNATRVYNEATGQLALSEEVPYVHCSPEPKVAPPTKASCSSFVPSGVVLHRAWETSDNDLLATMTDRWTSTGGGHSVSFLYYEELQSAGTTGGVIRFPGASSYVTTTKGQTIPFPAGPGTLFYKEDASTPETGDGLHPQGAMVYDRAPTGPAIVIIPGEGNPYNLFESPYTLAIPAGGEQVIRYVYPQGYGLSEVTSLAATALQSFYPSVGISAPGSGSVVGTPSVTVSGTASDTGALSSVTVNGAAVSTGGPWSTTVALAPGANTITATATDQAGLSRSASTSVTYVPPAAHASLLGAISALGGKVTLSVSCAGAATTTCSIHASLTTVERKRHGKILGVSARTTRRTVTIGALSATIAAGRTSKLTIKLNATGRKLLARFGKLPARLSVTSLSQRAKSTVLTKTVTIKPAPKRRKHRP